MSLINSSNSDYLLKMILLSSKLYAYFMMLHQSVTHSLQTAPKGPRHTLQHLYMLLSQQNSIFENAEKVPLCLWPCFAPALPKCVGLF